MRRVYLARGRGLTDTVAVDDRGVIVYWGDTVGLVAELHSQEVEACTLDEGLLADAIAAYADAGHFDRLGVAMRASGRSGQPAPLSARCDGWPARWLDPSGRFPEGDVAGMAELLGHGKQPDWTASPDEAADWLRRVHGDWCELVRGELGLDVGVTLASTAAAAGIPRSWRNAHKALAHRGDGWEFTRAAYYGGRVQCLQPGWTGEAVEYDLRSAYGWALTRPLPDWKIYDRKPWPSQPAWYDCTVQLVGKLGPLPVRDEQNPHRLTYPTECRARGIWTREDLDRAGVGVLQVHRVLSGRWSTDLAPTVSVWLEKRETADAPRRALYRGMANNLAGKLCQRQTSWSLWTATDGEVPPEGAVPLHMGSALWAIPVPSTIQPITCPQAGSYVTALVRSRVWPELTRPDAIYTDTDSIHLPADAPPPQNCGPNAGQWAPKVRGAAEYHGQKHYQIGTKRVRPATFHRKERASRSATAAAAAQPRG